MISIDTDKDLSGLNTLAVTSQCDQFIEIQSLDQVFELYRYLQSHQLPLHILGGGSNLLLNDHVSGVVAKVALRGVELLSEDDNSVLIKACAGESWHEFVRFTVTNGYSGLENLALIPGTVGASPVQNIGAYGVEISDCLVSVEAVDLKTGELRQFSNAECQFAYRDSVFKAEENRYFITSVDFELSTVFQPHIDYGSLQNLSQCQDLQPYDVFSKVIEVRKCKLPDPGKVPNAGSFFKNPLVSMEFLQAIIKDYPDMVWYESNGQAKIAAGWLIDSVGLKGKSNDSGVGCYSEQALVLINPLKADSANVQSWAVFVQSCIFEKYGIRLEQEPRFWS